MSPQTTLEAFWSALSRRAWQEAADLVHPDDARRRQRQDLNLIAACLAAGDRTQDSGETTNAVLLMLSPGADLTEGYLERPVTTFPGAPQLGELASLAPNLFLARSLAAQAARGEGISGEKRALPQIEIIGTVDESPELAHLEVRMPLLSVEDDEDPVHRVSLRRYAGAWQVLLEPDEFMAPVPWPVEDR